MRPKKVFVGRAQNCMLYNLFFRLCKWATDYFRVPKHFAVKDETLTMSPAIALKDVHFAWPDAADVLNIAYFEGVAGVNG